MRRFPPCLVQFISFVPLVAISVSGYDHNIPECFACSQTRERSRERLSKEATPSDLEKGEMKNLSIAVLLLLTAALSYGQAPKAALSTATADVYVGSLLSG